MVSLPDHLLWMKLKKLADAQPLIRESLVPLLKMAAGKKETVMYKGREYVLLWSGRTKYGEKAHLQFTNGAKDFWVPLQMISPVDVAPRNVPTYSSQSCEKDWPQSRCCPVCHKKHPYVPCGYPGCRPSHCDECDGGGRFCKSAW